MMGRKLRNILRALHTMDTKMNNFDLFRGYFVQMKSPVYESARFNQCRQMQGETVNHFATELHRLADRCEF